jgi:hypothetical protein
VAKKAHKKQQQQQQQNNNKNLPYSETVKSFVSSIP